MSKVAVQVIKRFYACVHKNVIRTFIVINGIFDEAIPCCIECHGHQMLRMPGGGPSYELYDEPIGELRSGFYEAVTYRGE